MANLLRDNAEDEDGVAVDAATPDDDSEWTVIPDPIQDGSSVMGHDGFDVQEFNQACREYSKLNVAIEEAAQRVVTAPALLRDLFFAFHKRVPKMEPVVPVTPAHEYNQRIIEQVLSTTEFQALRSAGTVGDLLTSAMATLGVAQKALAALDQTTIDAINRLAEHESGAAMLFDQASALQDLAEQAEGDRATALFEQAAQLRQEAAAREQEAQAAEEELEALDSEAIEDRVRQAARRGMHQVETEIDATNEACKAFAGGYDRSAPGGLTGTGQQLSTKEKMQLAGLVQKSQRLKQLAAMAGRFTRIALQVQETKTAHPPDEVTNIGTGNDLAHILPVELLALSDPELEDWFFARYLDKGLLQYELIGREKQGQGPIILAIDSSGSMGYPKEQPKEVWAKAIFLALLSIARLQKRDLVCIHFSNNLRLWQFPKGQADYPQVVASCEYFEGGETPFEPFMDKALQLVDEATYQKADVIILSDGLSDVHDEMRAKWNERRSTRGMRTYSVLIGTNEGAGLLASISDALMTITDLNADHNVLQTIFAV